MQRFNLKPFKFCKAKLLIIFFSVATLLSCEKFLAVDELKEQMLAEQVFQLDATANSAILGMYRALRGAIPTPLIINNSVYSNEILPYANALSSTYYTLNLQSSDTALPWSEFYSVIYSANNALEQLSQSSGIPENKKQIYIGEAKFLRAISHFYLVNLYGNIPLALTTDVATNKEIQRSSIETVYTQIINDLLDAKSKLPDNYSHASGNEKVRANKWCARALLARTYLYQKDYINAEAEASAVINSGKYSILNTPIGIFAKNNAEAILQLSNNSTDTNIPSTAFIFSSAPVYVCSQVLLNAFEVGDQRRNSWIRTSIYGTQSVSIPFKFTSTASAPPEYNTIIRLAEMYLIRAEARYMRNDFQAGVDDVNILRLKHGGLLSPLATPTNQTSSLDMVLHERQVELFTECGHRFFDLKRTGRIATVMSTEKPLHWKSSASLYPIPLTEIQRNPNLYQNQGYE